MARALINSLAALALLVPALALGEIPPERAAQLRHVLIQECGSCHGLTMRGGLGAPLRPENLAGKHDSALQAIILYGIEGLPMPAWNWMLSEAEAAYLVKILREGVAP
jgi:mono/diheme cytochrome c family protein